jgi:hypothetical protein
MGKEKDRMSYVFLSEIVDPRTNAITPLATCLDCGAVVSFPFKEAHTDWHSDEPDPVPVDRPWTVTREQLTGIPTPPRRGRPPGSKNKPKPVLP